MVKNTFISHQDKIEIHYYKWIPKREPKAVVQIVHGSIENALRYKHFAEYLVAQGFAVFAMDIRGHGVTGEKTRWGYFSDLKKAHNIVLEDVHYLNDLIRKDFPDKELILLGHSMGSFIIRAYVTKYTDINALVAIGTNHPSKILIKTLSFVSALLCKRKPGKFLHKLSYAPFNKRFKKEKDNLAWLSLNKANRESYSKSPYTKFIMTNNGFKAMASWMKMFSTPKYHKKKIDVLLVNGQDDPVGNFGKQVAKAKRFYEKLHFPVQQIEFANYRHEVLNEDNKEMTYNKIINFMEKYLKTKHLERKKNEK